MKPMTLTMATCCILIVGLQLMINRTHTEVSQKLLDQVVLLHVKVAVTSNSLWSAYSTNAPGMVAVGFKAGRQIPPFVERSTNLIGFVGHGN